MSQITLSFADAPRVPDAIINDSGIMVGNVLKRLYGEYWRNHVLISLAQHDGRWCYGLSVKASHSGQSFGPSLKWNEYASFEDAEREAVLEAVGILQGMAHKDVDNCVRRAAAELLRMLEQAQYTEQTESA